MDDYNPRTRYEHYYVRMARLEGRGELQKRYPDDFYVRPFQIAGNVYYIGNKAVCSHLIDTGEGLIVIDTSYPELDHLLINSIWEAGFDPKDIRIVLHTHLHYDHFGATNTLTKIYGAKAYVGRDEWESVQRKPELAVIPQDPYLSYRMIRPDVLLEDGDEIRLGNTVMLGAIADHLPFPADDLLACVLQRFQRKGEKMVELNRRAFAAGRASVLQAECAAA